MGILQQEARRERMQREPPEASGRRQHESLEVVHARPQLVERDRLAIAMREEPRLVRLAALLEDRDRLGAGDGCLPDRLVRRHDVAHPPLDRGKLL